MQQFFQPAVNAVQTAAQQGTQFVQQTVHAVQHAVGVMAEWLAPNDPAFSTIARGMDGPWAVQFGVPGQTLPSAPVGERPWLKAGEICDLCDIAKPATFTDTKQTGGHSCPFCAMVAHNQQLGAMQWFLHPDEKRFTWENVPDCQAPPKPPGRRNSYIHQVQKCPYGLAAVHIYVRRARDRGQLDKAEAAMHLFESRPRV